MSFGLNTYKNTIQFKLHSYLNQTQSETSLKFVTYVVYFQSSF
jgi:hypothetical protein